MEEPIAIAATKFYVCVRGYWVGHWSISLWPSVPPLWVSVFYPPLIFTTELLARPVAATKIDIVPMITFWKMKQIFQKAVNSPKGKGKIAGAES